MRCGRSSRAGGRLASPEPGHLHLRVSPALVPLVVGRQPRLTPLLPADASLGVFLRCSRQRLGFGSMNSVLSCHRGSSLVRSALPDYRCLDESAGECVPVSLSIRINERLRFGLPREPTNKRSRARREGAPSRPPESDEPPRSGVGRRPPAPGSDKPPREMGGRPPVPLSRTSLPPRELSRPEPGGALWRGRKGLSLLIPVSIGTPGYNFGAQPS